MSIGKMKEFDVVSGNWLSYCDRLKMYFTANDIKPELHLPTFISLSSPLSEYLFLPWLGVTLRGLVLRQIPTVTALVYTMAIIDSQHISLLFTTGFLFLFLMEARICLEIVREVRARWMRHQFAGDERRRFQVETLWSSEEEDVRSVEMRNFVY